MGRIAPKRPVEPKAAGEMAMPPSIIDLDAELAKLTMFRGRTRNRRWRIEGEAAHD
jgi:hypothetical protein